MITTTTFPPSTTDGKRSSNWKASGLNQKGVPSKQQLSKTPSALDIPPLDHTQQTLDWMMQVKSAGKVIKFADC